MTEGERLQGILDDIIRVTDGLVSAKVSFEVVHDYLMETIADMGETTQQRVLVLAVLEIMKERAVE